jgi:hypothetical protein
MFSELRLFLDCRKSHAVNRTSLVTLRDLELDGTGTVSRRCNSQLALFKTKRQSELQSVVTSSET